MPTAAQLYPAERLAGKTAQELHRLIDMAEFDLATDTTVYAGMTRAETVATAEQSLWDLWAAYRPLQPRRFQLDGDEFAGFEFIVA
ncbi:hypothetical protein [Amycolatopsis vancoresmycina]|uniref:Uncharacterized protein n=1 Tax=Amycolatopsis vancoresmycina DSM 44592 TaxID=1292037 RepID=R1GGP5_9PSEU|nr:hypothetical protein [Amycolatopsis vancoresmycina]EOD70353.1 hypothetical protein H480_01517 [Amycolatopsis vancoresmycina DSM 44592]